MEPGHSASTFSLRGKGLGFVPVLSPAFRPRLDVVVVVVGLLLLGLISLGRGMPF